jgi:hypothetical protein
MSSVLFTVHDFTARVTGSCDFLCLHHHPPDTEARNIATGNTCTRWAVKLCGQPGFQNLDSAISTIGTGQKEALGKRTATANIQAQVTAPKKVGAYYYGKECPLPNSHGRALVYSGI